MEKQEKTTLGTAEVEGLKTLLALEIKELKRRAAKIEKEREKLEERSIKHRDFMKSLQFIQLLFTIGIFIYSGGSLRMLSLIGLALLVHGGVITLFAALVIWADLGG